MKVDDISNSIEQINNPTTSSSKRAEEEKRPFHVTEKTAQPGTKVDLSDRSVEFSRAAEMMDNVPQDRAEKIDDLKTKVRNGTYNVDASGIAEKILDDALANIPKS